jgi:hypothetical protein
MEKKRKQQTIKESLNIKKKKNNLEENNRKEKKDNLEEKNKKKDNSEKIIYNENDNLDEMNKKKESKNDLEENDKKEEKKDNLEEKNKKKDNSEEIINNENDNLEENNSKDNPKENIIENRNLVKKPAENKTVDGKSNEIIEQNKIIEKFLLEKKHDFNLEIENLKDIINENQKKFIIEKNGLLFKIEELEKKLKENVLINECFIKIVDIVELTSQKLQKNNFYTFDLLNINSEKNKSKIIELFHIFDKNENFSKFTTIKSYTLFYVF